MKRILASLIATMSIGYVVKVCAEPPVLIFENRSVKLEHVYDARKQMYFSPVVDMRPYKELHDQGLTGKGVIAAVIDTGVVTHHPIIKKALLKSMDFTGEGVEDLSGHGTVVTLIFLTISPDASILNAKAVDKNGKGMSPNLIRAIKWAVQEGAQVLNISAGVYYSCKNVREYGEKSTTDLDSCEKTAICQTVMEAARQGVIISAAVGNEPGRTVCPACCRDVIAVGATTKEQKIAPYSGAYPDILAPGEIYLVPYKQQH